MCGEGASILGAVLPLGGTPPQKGVLSPPPLHGMGGEVLVLGGGAGAPQKRWVGGVTGQQQREAWGESGGEMGGVRGGLWEVLGGFWGGVG